MNAFRKTGYSWWRIALDVWYHGYNATAAKNPIKVRMPNGKIKRIRLTPEYIRDNLRVTYELAKDFVKYLPAYFEFREIWNFIVSNDRVVRDEFNKRLEENKKSTSLQPISPVAVTTNTDGKEDGNSPYEYKYHYIRHYDPELYKKDKKTQGKEICGPFTESEIRTFF